MTEGCTQQSGAVCRAGRLWLHQHSHLLSGANGILGLRRQSGHKVTKPPASDSARQAGSTWTCTSKLHVNGIVSLFTKLEVTSIKDGHQFGGGGWECVVEVATLAMLAVGALEVHESHGVGVLQGLQHRSGQG